MKSPTIFKSMALLLLAVVTLNSCSDDDNNNDVMVDKTMNIVQVAQENSDLSILVDAVIKANLVEALSANGEMTVLAPTNEAFTAFLNEKGFSSLDDVPTDVLTQILLNHVIPSYKIVSSSFLAQTGYLTTLADGPDGSKVSLYYDGTSGVTFNGNSEVITPDVMASNGIIHVVNKVIDLPTIATFATTNPALSTLVDVLSYADSGSPTVPYINTVSDGSAGPFTVFAPTNDAFGDLLAELGVDNLTDIPTDLVDSTLLMHIVSGNIRASQLTSGEVNTLGGPLTADASAFTITDANGREINIVVSLTDIQATNGVVHVIDKVILPDLRVNIVETAQANPDLSILVDAVVKANLVDALSADGSMTVLAPTNEAFTAFLADKGFASLDDVPVDALTQILLNHIVAGTNYKSTDIIGNSGYVNTLADGPNGTKLSLYYDGTSGVSFNGYSEVTTPDILATNGIIHVVNNVIDLPTIATFATANPALSTLVDVLAYADTGTPTVPYIDTVSDPTSGPFTVFAPTNDAFGDLLAELGVSALTDIPTDTVDAVLLMHIVNANVQSSQLTSGEVSTLGGPITADASAFTLTDANGRVSNINTDLVDIQGTNGVVHVIDKVILPDMN